MENFHLSPPLKGICLMSCLKPMNSGYMEGDGLLNVWEEGIDPEWDYKGEATAPKNAEESGDVSASGGSGKKSEVLSNSDTTKV